MASFETKLNIPVNFFVIPIFALANTSIVISPASLSGLGSPLATGIILGLFLGKPVGITLAVFLMIKLRLAELGKIRWSQLIGVGILAGIGFTMSIFVSNLAFPGNELYSDIAKLSVLIASGLAMTVGFIWLKTFAKGSPSPRATAP
jgi:NhaA family Na+:H+ antiporter